MVRNLLKSALGMLRGGLTKYGFGITLNIPIGGSKSKKPRFAMNVLAQGSANRVLHAKNATPTESVSNVAEAEKI